jgi:hypothetical protein
MTDGLALTDISNRLADRYDAHGIDASNRMQTWLEGVVPLGFQHILARHLEEQHAPLLFDAFWHVLLFRTGGRRGRVGYGSNRQRPHSPGTPSRVYSFLSCMEYLGQQGVSGGRIWFFRRLDSFHKGATPRTREKLGKTRLRVRIKKRKLGRQRSGDQSQPIPQNHGSFHNAQFRQFTTPQPSYSLNLDT